jgi:hypothetical protein
MSAEIKLVNKDGITLKTAGTYCADDIKITIDDPQLTSYNIRQGATILGVQGSFPQGIFPSGSVTINSTQATDVTRFATASVNSTGIASSNIKEGVSILGVSGKLKDSATCTAAASDIKVGETAVVNNKVVNGTMPKFEPDAAGYTPTTTKQILQTKNSYLESNITIKGDYKLVAANIKQDVTIFDVKGTFTSDATATANKILKDETAYVKGSKVTGTIETKTSSDLTEKNGVVTVPAGYYASPVTKEVAEGSATTPTTTITVAPTISIDSKGKITAKNDTSNTKKITPTIKAGYVSEGTEGTITVDGSKDYQMTTRKEKE